MLLVRLMNTVMLLALAGGVVYYVTSSAATRGSMASVQLEPLTGGGQPVRLADLQGKVVLLNFWGTWCPPCRAEFPHIEALAHRYQRRADFQLFAVSCGSGGDSNLDSLRQQTAQFLKASKSTLPTYVDPEGRTRQAVAKAIGFNGYPTTLVLDRDGSIQGSWVGYRSGSEVEMDQLIRKLLDTPAKKSPSAPAAAPVVNHTTTNR